MGEGRGRKGERGREWRVERRDRSGWRKREGEINTAQHGMSSNFVPFNLWQDH